MVHKAFSIETMKQDSTLAREFLIAIEEKSYRYLDPNWRESTEDEIIERACISFNALSTEMDTAERLSQINGIQ
jgi:hypothetical protein